jgi:hypothetical protein
MKSERPLLGFYKSEVVILETLEQVKALLKKDNPPDNPGTPPGLALPRKHRPGDADHDSTTDVLPAIAVQPDRPGWSRAVATLAWSGLPLGDRRALLRFRHCQLDPKEQLRSSISPTTRTPRLWRHRSSMTSARCREPPRTHRQRRRRRRDNFLVG